MKIKRIPSEHSIVRNVPPSRLRRDADDNVIGILGAAFKLREGEQYLSATWLEYFAGERTEKIKAAVWALRASEYKPGKNSGFAIGQVASILEVSARRKHKIRIVHEPEADNNAHAAVRQFPSSDPELLDLLASEAWAELYMNASIAEGHCSAPDKSNVEI